ncbi:MAG: LPS export ABC transporter periplasmic protein LptC [Azospirillaceae bacterium]|nr:LPS export ABC transporter periplasmic protein LptC [Azospirillaceae bacterium]
MTAHPTLHTLVPRQPLSVPDRVVVRRRASIAAARLYSRFVSAMKVLLPVLSLGVLALIAVWPSWHDANQTAASKDDGELHMIGARYYGVDQLNRPYSLVADNARQSSSEPGIVDLVKPQGEITLQNGNWVKVDANRGRFDQGRGQLLLLGEVALFQDQGYEFHTDVAHVDTTDNTAWGDDTIVGQGPFGEVHADGFRLVGGGTTIVFTGHSTMILAQGAVAGAGPLPAAAK